MGKFCSDFAGLAEISGEGKKNYKKRVARALARKKNKKELVLVFQKNVVLATGVSST
jgi:hypothetical protein